MRKGDLIFVHGRGPISLLVQGITHSPYSHVAIYIGDDTLVEAQGLEKTKTCPITKYPQFDVRTCDHLTDEQRQGIVDFAMSKEGTEYDYLRDLGIAIRIWTGVSFPYLDTKGKFICSSLAYDAYKSVGITLLEQFGEDVDPGEVYRSPELTSYEE